MYVSVARRVDDIARRRESAPPRRAGVLVYAKDPVSRAGVTSQLARWPWHRHPGSEARTSGRGRRRRRRSESTTRCCGSSAPSGEGSQAQVVLVVTDIDRPRRHRGRRGRGHRTACGAARANGEQLASVVGKARRGEQALPATRRGRARVRHQGGRRRARALMGRPTGCPPVTSRSCASWPKGATPRRSPSVWPTRSQPSRTSSSASSISSRCATVPTPSPSPCGRGSSEGRPPAIPDGDRESVEQVVN